MKQIYTTVVLAICVAFCIACHLPGTILFGLATKNGRPSTPRDIFGPHHKAIKSSWEGTTESFLVKRDDPSANFYALRFVPKFGTKFLFEDYDSDTENKFITLAPDSPLPLLDIHRTGFPVESLPEDVRIRVRGIAIEWQGFLWLPHDKSRDVRSKSPAFDPEFIQIVNGKWEATGKVGQAILVYQVHQIHPNGKATLFWDARNPKQNTVFTKQAEAPPSPATTQPIAP